MHRRVPVSVRVMARVCSVSRLVIQHTQGQCCAQTEKEVCVCVWICDCLHFDMFTFLLLFPSPLFLIDWKTRNEDGDFLDSILFILRD